MRFALIVVVTLILFGCSDGSRPQPLPTAPEPPPVPATPAPPAPELTFLSVVVTEHGGSGACVPGATVEIVNGQGLGRRVSQNDMCSYWDPDYNATFQRLNAGEQLTLRATAAGYAAKEVTVVPVTGPQPALSIELTRVR